MKNKTCIKQRDITDCGAACLVSVAMHYQLELPVSRIRQYAGTDKRGTNVLGLIEAAERLGLSGKSCKRYFGEFIKYSVTCNCTCSFEKRLAPLFGGL
jgi:ABC-type bacteriocin/lantibiotic exporter with double-glycine peptidase domain